MGLTNISHNKGHCLCETHKKKFYFENEGEKNIKGVEF